MIPWKEMQSKGNSLCSRHWGRQQWRLERARRDRKCQRNKWTGEFIKGQVGQKECLSSLSPYISIIIARKINVNFLVLNDNTPWFCMYSCTGFLFCINYFHNVQVLIFSLDCIKVDLQLNDIFKVIRKRNPPRFSLFNFLTVSFTIYSSSTMYLY